MTRTANNRHKTLCQKCNLGLGYFDDHSELLIKAISYLGVSP